MSHEIELKETMDAPRFAALLRAAADAVEGGSPMQLTLNGETRTVQPQGKLEVEYEEEHGKCELEFEMKWRAA
jgi:amphi-Trp domain-containing protein